MRKVAFLTRHPIKQRDQDKRTVTHRGIDNEACNKVRTNSIGAGKVFTHNNGPVQGKAHHDGQRSREHVGDNDGEQQTQQVAPVGGSLLPVEDPEEATDNAGDDTPEDEGDPVPVKIMK